MGYACDRSTVAVRGIDVGRDGVRVLPVKGGGAIMTVRKRLIGMNQNAG
jgi:hypothetical protein